MLDPRGVTDGRLCRQTRGRAEPVEPIAMLTPGFLGVPHLSAAVISIITAVVVVFLTLPFKEWVRLVVESTLYRRKADTDYRVEQRKALADAIGKHYGTIIDTADRFCHRLARLQKHADAGWLDPSGPGSDRYFYDSTLYRFLMIVSAAEALERSAVIIDPRVGRHEDRQLVWFVRALRWSLTAAELYAGTGYDPEYETEHFYTDTLRAICRMAPAGRDDPGFLELRGEIQARDEFEPVRRFFRELVPGTLRWDRLMVARLILIGLLNELGDDVQKTEQSYFNGVAELIESDAVAANFAEWVPRFKLSCKSLDVAVAARMKHIALPASAKT
jgi:hypothetical protein